MSQTVWIGIETDNLEKPIGVAVIKKEKMDRGEVIVLEQWNTGIEAVSVEGVVIGYGIVVSEDFPEEWTTDTDGLMTFEGYLPEIKRVLNAHGFHGPVIMMARQTDASLVPGLGMGEPAIPTKKRETIH